MLGIRNSSGSASMGVDSKVWCLSKINRRSTNRKNPSHDNSTPSPTHYENKIRKCKM